MQIVSFAKSGEGRFGRLAADLVDAPLASGDVLFADTLSFIKSAAAGVSYRPAAE